MDLTDHELWVLSETLNSLSSSYDWRTVKRIHRKLLNEQIRRGTVIEVTFAGSNSGPALSPVPAMQAPRPATE